MTPAEKVLGTALAVLILGGGAFAIGRATTSSPSASSSASAPAESAAGFSDNQLAASIAKQAGTKLAADSPGYLRAATVQALGTQIPSGAHENTRANTITFSSKSVSFTAVAVPPGGPDMTFRIGGLVNPTLIVPSGATVKVRFINADPDEAHGWQVTDAQPPFQFHPGQTAFRAATRVLGDPTSAGDGTDSVRFSADRAGSYSYVCPMPGHAQMGMHGGFVVGS